MCNTYLKIKKTEHLLQEYDIHDEELTTLSAQPARLLMQMYFKLTSNKTQGKKMNTIKVLAITYIYIYILYATIATV